MKNDAAAPAAPSPAPTNRPSVLLTYANALIWALGNGLVSTTLVVYLALDLGAGGVEIALLLTAPRLAGVLRIGAPALILHAHKIGFGRKAVCLSGYAASSAVLLGVPHAAQLGASSADATWPLGVLAFAWCLYHLLEYIATVALWSWIGDLYPINHRALLLGKRERWLTTGRLIGIGASVLLALAWPHVFEDPERWQPLAASAAVGAALMLTAIVPLAWTESRENTLSAAPVAPWRTLRQAITERPYRRLLAYSCWFGVANGLTASVQNLYPNRVLGIEYAPMQLLRAGMRGGQAAIAPWCGRQITRWGPRRVMLPAQLIVATGPLWFLLASPEQRWWVVLPYIAWIAYAALNVGLDTLKIGLADPGNNTPYLAVYHALSDLAYSSTALLGGLLYDTLARGDQLALRVYAGLFLAGLVARFVAAWFVSRIVDPTDYPPPEAP